MSTHRMLLNIYEADLHFLPREPEKLDRTALARFYNSDNLLAGEKARPILETDDPGRAARHYLIQLDPSF